MTKKAGSMKPSDAVSGGLRDDFDGEIKECRFEEFTYPGSGTTALVFRATIQPDEGDKIEEHYTIGDGWEAVDDGKAVEGKTAFAKSCKFMQFVRSVVDCGYDEEKMEGIDATIFEGIHGHFLRIEAEKRTGLDGGERKRPETTLCTTAIDKFPYDKKGAKAKDAGKDAGKGKGKSEAEEDPMSDRVQAEVMEILDLKENKKGMKKKDLAAAVHKALGKDKDVSSKDRVTAVKLIMSNNWHEGKPWDFDGSTGVVGG